MPFHEDQLNPQPATDTLQPSEGVRHLADATLNPQRLFIPP
ncbi:MAG TPA: hypothetical protein VIU45_03195 [Chitinophagaceae bacterium]